MNLKDMKILGTGEDCFIGSQLIEGLLAKRPLRFDILQCGLYLPLLIF